MSKEEGKMSLESAQIMAKEVLDVLAPYCEKAVVAGSIRRRRPWVNDIDLVLLPKSNDAWTLHAKIAKLFSTVKMSGAKILHARYKYAEADIYFATKENWATLLLIRTGSAENNIRLCTRAKERGWRLAASGDGLFNEKEERIAGDTELSIYQALGLPFQKPEERN